MTKKGRGFVGKFEFKAVSLINGLPMKIGGLTLRDAQPDAITSITPFKGKTSAVKKALGAWVEGHHGLGAIFD